jgi:nickel-dependent lactate racemase
VTRTTEIALPYGTEILKIQAPSDNLLAVASPREVAPQAGLETQVRQALREPVEAEPFSTLLRGGEHLLLLVDDVTRATPVDRILPVRR